MSCQFIDMHTYENILVFFSGTPLYLLLVWFFWHSLPCLLIEIDWSVWLMDHSQHSTYTDNIIAKYILCMLLRGGYWGQSPHYHSIDPF